ncbi:MAG: Hsp70 family protein, partial [Rhodospirillales bacterium]|nr:Hsp70 family protein [Rhodospirillales bacterium]
GTGKEQQIRIQASGGLSEGEIQKMVKDAEAHASEDKKRRELIEAKNHADSLIHTTEKNLKEHGDKVGEAEKSQIESDIAALKAVIDGDDAKAIQEKTQALLQSSMKLGEAMYKANQAGPGPGPDAGPGPGSGPDAAAGPDAAPGGTAGPQDGKVVDADFEEVDEKKGKSA